MNANETVDPRDAALSALRASGVREGELWRYRRTGRHYAVTCLCVLEAGCVPAVAYRGLADDRTVWVRPLAEFLDRFVREGS
jgi:hypothetical protein